MSIKSADRTLLILQAVAKAQPVSMRQLRDQLDIPRSSLHGLLQVMTESGFLDLNQSGDYNIGLKAFEVGTAWSRSVSVESAAAQHLRRLVDEANQIAHVGVLDNTDVIYILKQENPSPVRLVSAVGKRLPAHATALGKVLLSSLPDAIIAKRYAGMEFFRMTDTTLCDLDSLLKAVGSARYAGMSIDRGESTPGVTCFAAPIFERGGDMVAALSVSVIDADPAARDEDFYGTAVMKAAGRISKALGDEGGRS